jgi:hypothetical protein
VALDDPVVAGYFLARPAARIDEQNDASLVPARIVSASPCLAGPFLPEAWCLSWAVGTDETRAEAAEEVGIPADRVPEIVEWFTAQVASSRAFFPGLLATVEQARELRGLARSRRSDLAVLAMALPRVEVPRLLAASAPPVSPPGFAPTARPGVAEAVERGQALAPGGVALGHEPLTSCPGWCPPSCSWLCTGSERGVADALGIRPNELGLLSSAEDAIRVCRWLDEDVSPARAEPGPWFPWLLVRYDDR